MNTSFCYYLFVEIDLLNSDHLMMVFSVEYMLSDAVFVVAGLYVLFVDFDSVDVVVDDDGIDAAADDDDFGAGYWYDDGLVVDVEILEDGLFGFGVADSDGVVADGDDDFEDGAVVDDDVAVDDGDDDLLFGVIDVLFV